MTADTRQPTCAERLPEHLAGRLADIRAILARDDPDEPTEAERDDINAPGPLNEYPLGASLAIAVRVELSTGGPADYITATVDHGEVTRAEYHFADWFDHAETALENDDLDVVAHFIDALYGGLDELAEHVKRD